MIIKTLSIQTGQIYQHYKGDLYKIIGIARDAETLDFVVMYTSLQDKENFPKGSNWVRSLKVFQEEIIIDTTQQPRFKLLANSDIDYQKKELI